MSFSVQWEPVDPQNLDHDLSLDAGMISPPLENMAEDVKAAVAACARGAALIVSKLPGATFKVSAYGHVKQGEQDTSTANISIAHVIDPVATEVLEPEEEQS